MFRKMILAVATAAALIVGFWFHAPEAQAQRWRGGYYGPRVAYRGYYGRGYYGGWRARLSPVCPTVLRPLRAYGPYGYYW